MASTIGRKRRTLASKAGENRSENDAVRIVVVDDHPIMCDGLVAALDRETGFEVVGSGATCDDAVRLVEEHLPDLLLLDLNIPGTGIAAARTVSEDFPAVRILVITAYDDEHTVSEALNSGASGYVVKGISASDLARSVRAVQRGEAYVSPGLAARLLASRPKVAAVAATQAPVTDVVFSSREEQILEHVARGRTNREIAGAIELSEKTVKHYMTNILQKLHVRNRVEAAIIANRRLRGMRTGGSGQL